MTDKIREITQEFKKAVKNKYDIIEMKLFGSSSRGESTKSSDIDIMIRLPRVNRSIEKDLFNIAYDLELEHDCVLDVIVLPQDIRNYIPLHRNIEKERISI